MPGQFLFEISCQSRREAISDAGLDGEDAEEDHRLANAVAQEWAVRHGCDYQTEDFLLEAVSIWSMLLQRKGERHQYAQGLTVIEVDLLGPADNRR